MINTIGENKKLFSRELDFKPYYPSNLNDSIYKALYHFIVGSRYDNTTEEVCTGVMISSMFGVDKNTESSFMISPQDAMELSYTLLHAAQHALDMDNIKTDRRLSKQNLSNLINNKMIEKQKIWIKVKSHDEGDLFIKIKDDKEWTEQWGYTFDIEVATYLQVENHVSEYMYYEDASFSFEVNLFKVFYAYATNMIKNNLVDSKCIKTKNQEEPVSYFEVLKQYILMQIIGDMYINISLYPEKELDELFVFENTEEFQNDMDTYIDNMIEIVNDDIKQISSPDLNNKNIKIVPINTQCENDSSVSSKDDVIRNTNYTVSKY